MNKQLLKSILSDGGFISVVFKTKSGTIRKLNGRVNVKHNGNITPMFTYEDRYILLHTKQGFRSVNIKNIISLNAKGAVILQS